MASSCFICGIPLSDGDTVTVERGIQSIIHASICRNDGHIEHLKNVRSVTVHTNCRKNYRSKNSIAGFKRRQETDVPSTYQCSPRKKRIGSFSFKEFCFICGEEANEAIEKKKNSNIDG